MECQKCAFYTKPLFGEAHCTRIRDYNVKTKKATPMKVSLGRKICKGYFFEYNDSDLYPTKDSSLSNEKNPFDY